MPPPEQVAGRSPSGFRPSSCQPFAWQGPCMQWPVRPEADWKEMRSMASGRPFRRVWNRKKAVSLRRTRIAEDDVSVKKNDHLRVEMNLFTAQDDF